MSWRELACWRLPIAVLGVLIGLALPVGGCLLPPCPEYEFDSSYRITEHSDRPDWVAGSGRVELSDTTIVVSYETLDGSLWEVEFERE